MTFKSMMMMKLMQEPVTAVASCGVIEEAILFRWAFSFIKLEKAAYTARRYAITPTMQEMVRQIFGTKKKKRQHEKMASMTGYKRAGDTTTSAVARPVGKIQTQAERAGSWNEP